MKQNLKMTMIAACLCLTGAGTANAQWVVSDPTNLAQSIINSAKEMVETAGTKANTLNGFLETKKVFEQGKKYYDALKSVHDVVKGGVKVSKSISLVMEISEIYVNNYQKMLSDENYSPEELAAISSGYAMLIDESSDVLQDLKNVVNGRGTAGDNRQRLPQPDELPQPRALLHEQDHFGVLPPGEEEERHGPGDRTLRKSQREILVNYGRVRQPSPDTPFALRRDDAAVRGHDGRGERACIDVYPLLRPFALGLCILFFPTIVLGTMNSVLSPIVQGVHGILEEQTFDMNEYREQKDKLEYEAMMRNPETAYLASDEEFDRQLDELGWSPSDLVTMTGMYMDRAAYNIKKTVRDWFRELLELMFAAAALIIDTLRTFFLVVLSILGPIAFAFAVWDGFHSTLSAWFSRYIQIYLWLPVSDLFSTILAKIQILMLQNDIQAMQSDPNFSVEASNGVYIVFLIIGIVGYFTIPTVAGWIIQAGGGIGSYNKNINTAGALGGSVAGAAAGNVAGRAGKLIKGTAGKLFRR